MFTRFMHRYDSPNFRHLWRYLDILKSESKAMLFECKQKSSKNSFWQFLTMPSWHFCLALQETFDQWLRQLQLFFGTVNQLKLASEKRGSQIDNFLMKNEKYRLRQSETSYLWKRSAFQVEYFSTTGKNRPTSSILSCFRTNLCIST